MTWLTKKVEEQIGFIWRKKYLETLFAASIIGTPVLFYLCSRVSDFLIFYTLLAILWYTRETMDLKRNSSKELYHLRVEHKTNLRPYLRLQSGGQRGLILVNEGKGVAVNLRPVYESGTSGTRDLLKVPAMAAAPNSVTESFVPKGFALNLNPNLVQFTIEIAYNDIEGRNYLAVFKSNPLFNDGFEIIKQEEVER